MIITFDYGHKKIFFDNGYTISIYNGAGSYTENHFKTKLFERKIIISKTCEIAIIKGSEFVTKEVLNYNNNVMGYVTKKELKQIIKKVRKLK